MLRPDFVADGPNGQASNEDSSFLEHTHVIQLQQQQSFTAALNPGQTAPGIHPGANGERYYTIQRVNGNGGNGKGDGVAGPHKHTLEDSDRIKKNTVQRHLMKEAKEKKRSQVSYVTGAMPALSRSVGALDPIAFRVNYHFEVTASKQFMLFRRHGFNEQEYLYAWHALPILARSDCPKLLPKLLQIVQDV